jgi:hypothetical protein
MHDTSDNDNVKWYLYPTCHSTCYIIWGPINQCSNIYSKLTSSLIWHQWTVSLRICIHTGIFIKCYLCYHHVLLWSHLQCVYVFMSICMCVWMYMCVCMPHAYLLEMLHCMHKAPAYLRLRHLWKTSESWVIRSLSGSCIPVLVVTCAVLFRLPTASCREMEYANHILIVISSNEEHSVLLVFMKLKL